MASILVVMGVSGSGKTTLGQRLAERLGGCFADADDYHPQANIDKMSQGIPLMDADRTPWLAQLNQMMRSHLAQKQSLVLACSALKESYRQQLSQGIEASLQWVYLHGSFEQIEQRLSQREGHFMKVGLLRSQFEDLEPPANALTVDVSQSIDQMLEIIIRYC
ncbi:MAG: gluconokinase [Cyanobacteria bacterium P01_G01_bin.38]